jgi:hypothetical protein
MFTKPLKQLPARDGDAVLGVVAPDSLELEFAYLASAQQINEFIADRSPVSTVYFGAFPSADNDGADAVTLVLPDSDGIVRNHPY